MKPLLILVRGVMLILVESSSLVQDLGVRGAVFSLLGVSGEEQISQSGSGLLLASVQERIQERI